MNQEVKVLTSIGIITIAFLLGAVFFFSNSNSPNKNEQKTVDNNLLIKENSSKIATDSAKVTIVEFGDYQCPACKAAFPIVKQILNDYSGRVNFVFRHFPLPQHKNGFIASEAVEAAGEQGKYWEMHNLMYENQQEWEESNNPIDIFLKYATKLNLNPDQFKSSITQGKYKQKINDDKGDGVKLGVNSTPTFYINGEKLNGFSYNEFKRLIDSNL